MLFRKLGLNYINQQLNLQSLGCSLAVGILFLKCLHVIDFMKDQHLFDSYFGLRRDCKSIAQLQCLLLSYYVMYDIMT